jgi:hypothetical protein
MVGLKPSLLLFLLYASPKRKGCAERSGLGLPPHEVFLARRVLRFRWVSRSPREAPPREGLACWARICFLLLVEEYWAVEWAQEQVDRDTLESSTLTMSKTVMPHVCGIIITKLTSLSIHTVDMCNTTIKIQNI